MPVTRISASVDWSMNSGAGLWIGERRLVKTGPRSSTGSPTTLRMRPKVSGPTGTVIGSPVSTASAPRTSPSVVSIATVRTVFSPRCCATSSTSVRPPFSTCSEFRIDGNSPSKRTSTTAPMTWVIVPTLLWVVLIAMFSVFLFQRHCGPMGPAFGRPEDKLREAISRSVYRRIEIASSPAVPRNDGTWNRMNWKLERLGAGDDLDQLLGDNSLASAVVVHRQAVDHFAGITRRVVHRGHPRTLFAGHILQQRGIDLHCEIVRQQLGQDFLFARLEFVDRAAQRINRAFRAGCGRRW